MPVTVTHDLCRVNSHPEITTAQSNTHSGLYKHRVQSKFDTQVTGHRSALGEISNYIFASVLPFKHIQYLLPNTVCNSYGV